MRGEIRKCPVCGQVIPRGKLMCRTHWFAVSADTRRRVNATWRAFKAADRGEPALFALRAYRVAHEAALAEAMGQQSGSNRGDDHGI